MTTVRLRVRSDLRQKWRAWLVLVLMLGLIGGAVLTAAAGARRTDTAYARFLQADNSADLLVSTQGDGFGGYYDAVARLPRVAATATAQAFNMAIPVEGGTPDYAINAWASPHNQLNVTVSRAKVLEGRMPDPTDPRAVVVDPAFAASRRLHPGSTFHLLGVPVDAQGNPDVPRARTFDLRVAAVAVFDQQVVPANKANAEPTVLFTPAFLPGNRDLIGAQAVFVRLRPGTDKAGVVRQVNALAARYPAVGGQVYVADFADQQRATEQAIHPEAVALALFALLAGIVGLVIASQLLSRQVGLDSEDYPVLRSLGMTRRQLVRLALIRVGLLTIGAAVVAVAGAIAASPLMPVGPARLAEPQPGVEVNVALLGTGFVAVALLPLLLVVPAALRAGRRAGPQGEPVDERSSRLAAALGRAGGPISGTIGVRMAFEPGRGPSAVPVRGTLAGTVIAIAAVVAALVFGANLNHLVSTPSLYGQNWDRQVDLGFGAFAAPDLASLVASQHGISGYAAGSYGQLTVDGKSVPAISMMRQRGDGFVTVRSGRPPHAPDEIALGTETLRALDRNVGDTVTVRVGDTARQLRVVGEVVFPAFSQGSFTATDLGSGALVDQSTINPSGGGGGCLAPETCFNFALVRYGAGADGGKASASLQRAVIAAGCPPGECMLVSDQRPATIGNYARVRNTPLVLSTVLGLFGVAMLTYVLVTSVRRRRRDLAMLKTLGFLRRQVQAVVAWQATALTAVALVVGLPLGVALGRWTWMVFASSLGVPVDLVVPLVPVLLAIPVTLVLGNLAAALPGWRVSAVRPGIVLRSE